mgnify:CR=1 FL=1
MNDPISDFLTRLRNANHALLNEVVVSHSQMKESIAGILKREGVMWTGDFEEIGTPFKPKTADDMPAGIIGGPSPRGAAPPDTRG